MTTQDRLRDACRTVLRGFDEHIFLRSIEHDHEPTWGLRLAPYLQALAVMICETGYESAHPARVLPTLDYPNHVEPHQNRRESGASGLQPLAAVAAILTTLALTAALQRPTPAGRHYHPMPLAQIAQAAPGDPIVPTHVVTSGTVRMVRQEADGDLHVRLCAQDDPATCIVLECIPELPCKAPRYGDHVTAQGISRWDTAHRWQEIHPLLSLEVDK